MTKRTENQGNSQTRQQGLDISRMTREHFYPDILKGDLDKIKIPTVPELTFLGWMNASGIRGFFRREEEKLSKMQERARDEISNLDSPERFEFDSLFYGQSCNWYGCGYARPHGEARNRMNEADLKKRRSIVGSCNHGHFVAEWCGKSPWTNCDRLCSSINKSAEDVSLRLAATSAKTAEQRAEALMQACAKIPVITSEADCPLVPDTPQCEHYHECRGTQPFMDNRCALLDEGKREECLAYLHEVAEDLAKRQKVLEKYMHNLSVAMSKCDQRHQYQWPDFYPYDGIVTGSGPEKWFVQLTYRASMTFDVQFGQRKLDKYDLDGTVSCEARIWSNVNADDYADITLNYEEPIDLLRLNLDDYLYLLQHPDYREVWLSMSDFRMKVFKANALDRFMSKYDNVAWEKIGK